MYIFKSNFLPSYNILVDNVSNVQIAMHDYRIIIFKLDFSEKYRKYPKRYAYILMIIIGL